MKIFVFSSYCYQNLVNICLISDKKRLKAVLNKRMHF